MDRTPVSSSMVKSVGYHEPTLTLEVEFISPTEPRIYHYAPVTYMQFCAIVDPTNSAGKLINELKRNPAMSCNRVEVAA